MDRCSLPNVFRQFLPVSPNENISLWLMAVLTQERRHSAEGVYTGSQSQPYLIDSIGEEKIQEEGRILVLRLIAFGCGIQEDTRTLRLSDVYN